MTGEGEGRGDMHVPLPSVARNPGTHLDQTTDQPFDRSLNLLSPEVQRGLHAGDRIVRAFSTVENDTLSDSEEPWFRRYAR